MCEKEKVVVLISHMALARENPLAYPGVESVIAKYDLDGCEIAAEPFRKECNNEDPYIWTRLFLYSFCHANDALKKENRTRIKEDNIYFCFFSRNKSNLFQLDTVIMGQYVLEWGERPAGGRKKNSVRNLFKNFIQDQDEGISLLDSKDILNDIMDHHLPFDECGIMSEHDKKKVYTIVGDKDNSFLPLVKKEGSSKDYIPYYFDESESEKIERLFRRKKGNTRFYVVAKDVIEEYVEDYPEEEELNDCFKEIEHKIIDEVIGETKMNIRKITSEQLYPLYIDCKETFRSC